MPRTEREFDLDTDAGTLATYLSDAGNVSKLLPFIAGTNEKGEWLIKDQHSKVVQTKKLVPTLTVEPGGTLVWSGKGEKLTAKLELDIKGRKDGSKVKAALAMELEGALGTVLTPIIALNIRNQLDAFVSYLRECFEEHEHAPGECHSCPICGH